MNRNRLAKTLYEWRFYPVVPGGSLEQFEIPLAGPLVARPLRLLAFEMKPDGTPALLEVLASVGIAGAEPTPAQREDMVFGAEDPYASGNLIVLRFDDASGAFAFRSITQVKVGDSPEDPFPVSTAALLFRADATVVPVSKVPITLGLGLKEKGGDIDIASASLTARLFGQACTFDLRDARFLAGAIVTSCSGDPGDSPLQLKGIDLSWPKAGAPTLTLTTAQLRAPLRAKDAGSPVAFARDYGAGEIHWLALKSIEPPIVREDIDHDAGVVRIGIDQETARRGAVPRLPAAARTAARHDRIRAQTHRVRRRRPDGRGRRSARLRRVRVRRRAGDAPRSASRRSATVTSDAPTASRPGTRRCGSMPISATLKKSTIKWPVGDAAVGQCAVRSASRPGRRTGPPR